MSEHPPKDSKKQAEADARSKRNRDAALEVQKKGMSLRAEQLKRERTKRLKNSAVMHAYKKEKDYEDYTARRAYNKTHAREESEHESRIQKQHDADQEEVRLREQVKERLVRRKSAQDAIGPVIDAKKKTVEALRKAAATTTSRDMRRSDLLQQAATLETEIVELEQQLRDMVLRPNKLKQETVPAKDESAAEHVSEETAENAPEETVEMPSTEQVREDRSAASPFEAIDARLRDLMARFSSSETSAAERNAIREELKEAMAERERLLSLASVANESGTIEYDQVPEFKGNDTYPFDEAVEATVDKNEFASEKKKPKAAPQNDIVMLNSVLTRQAMGAEKRTKKNAEKMKKFGAFLADPRYGGTAGTASTEAPAEVAPTLTRTERLAAKRKEDDNKRRWLVGGAGVLGVAGLLALLNPFGKKEEVTAVKQPERPAATRSAKDAGLKTPPGASVGDTSPAVTVPAKPEAVPVPAVKEEEAPKAKISAAESQVRAKVDRALEQAVAAGNLSEEDAQMVMVWEHMAYEKAGEALPPGSDTRIASVVETIRANRENPYAFTSQAAQEQPAEDTRPEAAPAAPEAVSESVQSFMYGRKGREIVLLVSKESDAAFTQARDYAKTLPANGVVRFEAISIDPVTKVAEPLRGAFMSLGDGRTSPLLRDPETGAPFTAPDPSLMSRARRAGEAAAGR